MARPASLETLWAGASWYFRDQLAKYWAAYEADNKQANDEYSELRAEEIAAEETAELRRKGGRRGFPLPRNKQGQEVCRKRLHLFSEGNIILTKNGDRIQRRCRKCWQTARNRSYRNAGTSRRSEVA